MEVKRIVIYSKDIEKITGRSGRYARKVMATLRRDLGKQKHQFVSLGEFCSYTGIPEAEVMQYLNLS
ncbi:hypothetical protein KK062_21150 [Fulvivirgaceae bacterium PWU5]|uniref:Uncharacterized protein n=1 Tax=Dawidia cretensis TaxID=2782350 RepID=A0AAP2E302_9BACT|nr:hypothetical protein [Dawidia cretensis]MBT1710762.1 hypothetical protein [Dawidia cretensis]